MAKKRLVNLEFPLGGLDERFAIQRQKPFTTVDALNVRPDGTLEKRTRGGSRPGLGRAFSELLGSGNNVNMLAQVRSVAATGQTEFVDDFDGDSGVTIDSGVWDAVSDDWTTTDSGLPVLTGSGRCDSTLGRAIGVRKAITDFDIGTAYKIVLKTTSVKVGGIPPAFSIYLGLDDTAPNVFEDGVFIQLVSLEGFGSTLQFQWKLFSFLGGIELTNLSGSGTAAFTADPVTLQVTVSGTTVGLTINGTSAFSETIHHHRFPGGSETSTGGTRVAFSVDSHLGTVEAYSFQMFYSLTSEQNVEVNKNFVVAASNESLYLENQGALDTVSTSLTIASDRQIASQQRAGTLFIADYSDPSGTGTAGVLTSSVLDDDAVVDWTAIADTDDDVVVITAGTGGTANGNYRITSISALGGLTLTTNPGDGFCSWRIERALKTFNPRTSVLTVVVASAGSVPAGNPLIALYRDRLTLAGAALAPHVWYMSKQGDPTNWSLGGTSSARAVAGLTTDAGQHPAPITALAPFHDDYFIFGAPTSLWVLRGDPAIVGGFLDNISQKIGILGMRAWAYDPVGGLYFMGRPGLYYLTPGAVGETKPVSEGKLPAELVNIDANANDVMLAYDVAARGLHICITPKISGVATQWWFDTELQSFWKVSLSSDHHASSLLSYDADSPIDAGVLLGCRDGRIRKFDNMFSSDDGTAISSHVLIGPVALGGGEYLEGKVKELIATLDVASGDVSYSVLTGGSAQAASTATATTTGTITNGANNSIRPQGRGRYFYLKLANGNGTPWAVEGIIAKLAAAGRFRK